MSQNTLFQLSGQVVYGQQIGQTIGFPTANIRLDNVDIPLNGVFAIQLTGIKDCPINGVANVGNRPTLNGQDKNVEVHLFNFSEDIYHRQVSVDFLHKIREEKKFDSLPSLKRQIQKDCAQAKKFFQKPH